MKKHQEYEVPVPPSRIDKDKRVPRMRPADKCTREKRIALCRQAKAIRVKLKGNIDV